ncbi:MAG: hypothetical protein COC05_06745 [Gammaproteobacteria bacterium]|nr:MAG: hypothetical protein COC05_06745 [Gammaproteobacteria bacterium]
MLRHEEERRAALRVAVSCKFNYSEQVSGRVNNATLSNLSASGIAFQANEPFELGALLDVRLEPGNTLTPSLDATIEVVRVDTCEDLRSYNVAGRITQIHH